MQALIDFDGWRKWKDFTKADASDTNEKSTSRVHKRSGSYVPVANSKHGSSLSSTDVKDKALADGTEPEGLAT
jgi:hypothetical protein